MKNQIGITLNGDVPLDLFVEVIRHFNELITNLSHELAGDVKIDWQIAELEAGSATAEIVGYASDINIVERVVCAYETVGRALEMKKPIPYSSSVVKAAEGIASIIDGRISSVEFHTTDDFTSCITESPTAIGKPTRINVYGTITGLVETLSRRQTLRFILYDDLFDKAIKCFFEEDQREMMRDIWDKKVTVTGRITRDAITGRPLEMHDIQNVKIISDRPQGSFKRARGVIPWREGNEYAEVIIRRIRDEE
jgi:hypothetical protein